MKITINGTQKELNNPIALEELIGQLCKNSKHVIAEVNGEIIASDAWAKHSVREGDSIELVSFVGGG